MGKLGPEETQGSKSQMMPKGTLASSVGGNLTQSFLAARSQGDAQVWSVFVVSHWLSEGHAVFKATA